jgi:hypothetical protein
MRVISLMDSPMSLMRPTLAARVVRTRMAQLIGRRQTAADAGISTRSAPTSHEAPARPVLFSVPTPTSADNKSIGSTGLARNDRAGELLDSSVRQELP